MNKEYIEREALIARYDAEHVGPPGRARELMVTAPAVVEVRHGRWEEAEDDYFGLHIIKCSECREEWCFEVDDDVKDLNYNYCPHCGCKMDKEE